MAIGIGSTVRVKPPFDEVLPGEHEIIGQDAITGAWQIQVPDNGPTDFDESNLEEVI